LEGRLSGREGIGGSRSDTSDSLVEFGKKLIIDSVTVVNDYIKVMIPLTTGLITTYFALLEFLGVKDVINLNKISATTSIEPTIYMLGSLIAFILTLFPMFRTIDLGNYENIKKIRSFYIIYRYGGTLIGMSLFLIGIYLMIQVINSILENG
jgi:hypothetical protein